MCETIFFIEKVNHETLRKTGDDDDDKVSKASTFYLFAAVYSLAFGSGDQRTRCASDAQAQSVDIFTSLRTGFTDATNFYAFESRFFLSFL